MFHLPVSTLRYYDKEGLFPHLERQSGIRQFGEREIETLRIVECLKASGLEIREIRQFMQWTTEGSATYPQRRQLFGCPASAVAYADDYLKIYACGTVFVMLAQGLNPLILTQGCSLTAMGTVLLGAVVNIALDPLLIFTFHMGVAGSSLATVLSQACSCAAVAAFFWTRRSLFRFRRKEMRFRAARLKQYRSEKDRNGLMEAEKALKRYPHAFDVVYGSAALYRLFGVQEQDSRMLNRALTLLESARRLLPQNTDPRINESVLCGQIAGIQIGLGQTDAGVEALKQANAGGCYDDQIGLTLAADCQKPEEALPFLQSALLVHTASLIRTVVGYVNVFFERRDYAEAQAILAWGIQTFSGLKNGEKTCFLDKVNGMLRVCLAYALLKTGGASEARRQLEQAAACAAQFDEAPDYRADAMRFQSGAKATGIYDDLGTTARESLEKTVQTFGDGALTALWQEVVHYEA